MKFHDILSKNWEKIFVGAIAAASYVYPKYAREIILGGAALGLLIQLFKKYFEKIRLKRDRDYC